MSILILCVRTVLFSVLFFVLVACGHQPLPIHYTIPLNGLDSARAYGHISSILNTFSHDSLYNVQIVSSDAHTQRLVFSADVSCSVFQSYPSDDASYALRFHGVLVVHDDVLSLNFYDFLMLSHGVASSVAPLQSSAFDDCTSPLYNSITAALYHYRDKPVFDSDTDHGGAL